MMISLEPRLEVEGERERESEAKRRERESNEKPLLVIRLGNP